MFVFIQILCGAESYDAAAPTKQNLLCGSKSPLEIIQDLKGEQEKGKEKEKGYQETGEEDDEALVERIKPVYKGPKFVFSAKV